MSSPALTRTRIALSALMATATLATAGMVTSLAIADSQKNGGAADTNVDSAADQAPAARTDRHKTTRQGSAFAPTRTATTAPPSPKPAPTHTKTKGS